MNQMIVVETPRLWVRQWVPDDCNRFAKLATDPRVLRYIGDGQPWPQERIQRFVFGGIEKSKTRGWVLWPVIHKEDSELIGICGFNDGFAPDVEIGWWLAPEYWGQGLATEAARAVMEYGFRTLGFERLISVAQVGNDASIRVMEKLGMRLESQSVHEGREVVRYCKERSSGTAGPTSPGTA